MKEARTSRFPALLGAAVTLSAFIAGWHAAAETTASGGVRFRLLEELSLSVGSDAGARSFTLADVNDDKRADLVAINLEDGVVSVLLGAGDGTFGTPLELEHDGFPTAVTVADVSSPAASAAGGDRDGNPDIIAVDDIGEITVWLGRGDGGFDPGEQDFLDIEWADLEPLDLVAVAAADFDRADGRPDLALLERDPVAVFFLCNDRGVFEPCPTEVVETGGVDPIDFAPGDFDGDGNVDFALLSRGSVEGQPSVWLIRGLGGGTFDATPTAFEAAVSPFQEPRGLAVGLLDTGSFDDVVVVNLEDREGEGTVALYGAADGLARRTFPVPLFATGVGLGDFDADGATDALTSRQTFGEGVGGAGLLPGDGLGGFRDAVPASGTEDLADSIAIAVGRIDGDDLPDFIALASTGDRLRVGINVSDAAVPPTGTVSPSPPGSSSPTPTPTRTATATRTRTSGPTATAATPDALPPYLRCDVGATRLGISGGRLVGGAVGGFDDNQSPDLALADDGAGRVIIALTDSALFADGSCPEAITASSLSVSGPRAIATALFNADRNLDLAVARRDGVTVFNGSGAGGFAAGFTTASDGPVAVDAADLDGDGLVDMAVGN